jgi:hypothetical protein
MMETEKIVYELRKAAAFEVQLHGCVALLGVMLRRLGVERLEVTRAEVEAGPRPNEVVIRDDPETGGTIIELRAAPEPVAEEPAG